jgi:cytochrome c oxidase subunit II
MVPGRSLFQAKGCSGCHSLVGVSTSPIGPDLTSLADVAGRRKPGFSPEAYVRESILDPQAFIVVGYGGVQMPRLRLSDGETDALVTFLLSGQ